MSIKRMSLVLATSVGLLTGMAGQDNRAIDGSGNNPNKPELGTAGGALLDDVTIGFEDGFNAPARPDGMNPRSISNFLFQQDGPELDPLQLSDFVWAFGQFLDHDITLVANYPDFMWQTEGVPVIVPQDDQFMTPGKMIPVMRSLNEPGTGTDITNPRRYSNEITAFIDASAVYGSTRNMASWLRSYEGGKMKVSRSNLLPWNTIDGEFNSPVDPTAPVMDDAVGRGAKHFVAGDVRANENPLLTSLHLLFVREHNRLCEAWLEADPSLDGSNPVTDELLYQRARKVVGAILQKIVYYDWLPSLGVDLPEYKGYDLNTDPSITNLFAGAAFRWGHTAINSNVLRFDLEGNEVSQGHISLADAFFNPLEVLRNPIEIYFKGMGIQNQQNIDCKLVDPVRNFLFKDNPFLGGLDLAAINIQRGRERGLPHYNQVRIDLGLTPRISFAEICIDADQTSLLEMIYDGDINSIDPWVGMLAEDHLPNSMFGELTHTIMVKQFRALRDGDRYYFEYDGSINDLDMELIWSTNLSDLIVRNTSIECFQENAFEATPHEGIPCWPEVFPTNLDIAISPNPITDNSYLTIYASKEREAVVRVVDPVGRTASVKTYDLVTGDNRLLLDWGDIWVQGYYYVVVESGDHLNALKVLRL